MWIIIHDINITDYFFPYRVIDVDNYCNSTNIQKNCPSFISSFQYHFEPKLFSSWLKLMLIDIIGYSVIEYLNSFCWITIFVILLLEVPSQWKKSNFIAYDSPLITVSMRFLGSLFLSLHPEQRYSQMLNLVSYCFLLQQLFSSAFKLNLFNNHVFN